MFFLELVQGLVLGDMGMNFTTLIVLGNGLLFLVVLMPHPQIGCRDIHGTEYIYPEDSPVAAIVMRRAGVYARAHYCKGCRNNFAKCPDSAALREIRSVDRQPRGKQNSDWIARRSYQTRCHNKADSRGQCHQENIPQSSHTTARKDDGTFGVEAIGQVSQSDDSDEGESVWDNGEQLCSHCRAG